MYTSNSMAQFEPFVCSDADQASYSLTEEGQGKKGG